jgi:hypothetical protein
VGVDIDLNWRVHANYTETSDDFRVVRDLLGAQEKLVVVLFPTIVEALETFRREANGCCGGKVQTSGIEEI